MNESESKVEKISYGTMDENLTLNGNCK